MKKRTNDKTLTVLKWTAVAILCVGLILALPVMGSALIGGIVGSFVTTTGISDFYQQTTQYGKNIFGQGATSNRRSTSSSAQARTTRANRGKTQQVKTKVSRARGKAKAKARTSAKIVHIKKHKTASQQKLRRHA